MPSFCDEEGYCEALDDCTAIDVGECSCCNINRIVRAFNRGIEYQKQNSKTSWISVEDDLPCNHEELVEYDVSTVLVFVKTKYSTDTDYMRLYGDFTWRWERYRNITHWMIIPELSEE